MSELSKEEKEMLKGAVAMPGDADEPLDKIQAERKVRASKDKDEKDEKRNTEPGGDNDLGDQPGTSRGVSTPVQFDDDGFADLPVQMRD